MQASYRGQSRRWWYLLGRKAVCGHRAVAPDGDARPGNLLGVQRRRPSPRRPKGAPVEETIDRVAWLVAWALLAVTLYYSLGPVPAAAEAFPHADTVLHAAMYAAVTFAFLMAAVWRPGRGAGRFPWAVWLIPLGAVVSGALIEVLQGAFFGRDMQLLDGLADLVGVCVATGAWLLIRALSSTPA